MEAEHAYSCYEQATDHPKQSAQALYLCAGIALFPDSVNQLKAWPEGKLGQLLNVLGKGG